MEGFDAFFEQSYRSVVRSVALAVGDVGVAEESVQEAFARAYRKWRRVQAMDRPVAWVYVVAWHHAVDGHRHLAREETVAASGGEEASADASDASYLSTLAQEAGADVDLDHLNKAEASKRLRCTRAGNSCRFVYIGEATGTRGERLLAGSGLAPYR